MLHHLIIHFSLYYLSNGRLLGIKHKGKFQTFSSRSGHGRLQEVPNIVISLENVWYFRKLLAEERRSLIRGGLTVVNLNNRPLARPSHMVQNYIYWLSKLRSGSSKTMYLSLFWKFHCATCSSVYMWPGRAKGL